MFSSQLIELLVADNIIGVPLPPPSLIPGQGTSADKASAQRLQAERISDPSVASYLGESAQTYAAISMSDLCKSKKIWDF